MVWFERILPYIGWGVILVASVEWWLAVKVMKRRVWLTLAFLMTAAGFLCFLYLDRNWLLLTYFAVVLFDGSCQVTGQLVGKRALLPRISPRKTIEGLSGGAIVTLATILLTRNSFSMTWGSLILTTCLVMTAAFTGDLLASAIKREAGIADFGRAIPGHGGIIDRFDSLMMAGAVIYLLSLVQQLFK
jgi:phosphatidate cytidylyltransferase